MRRFSSIKFWGFILGTMFFIGSCGSNSSPTSITSLPGSNQEAVLEQNACIWGYVLTIDGSPVEGATVKLYEKINGDKILRATYTTDANGYFQAYYLYSIVDPPHEVIFEASNSSGTLTGFSRSYAEGAHDSPCISNDVLIIAHDTIYLSNSGGVSLW